MSGPTFSSDRSRSRHLSRSVRPRAARDGATRAPSSGARAEAGARALIRLSEAAAAGLTPPQVLDLVAEAATSVAGDALVHVWLADDDGRELRLVAEFGTRPGRTGVPLGRVLRVDEGLAGAVARSPEPVVVASVRRERRLVNRAWARDQSLASFAGVRFARGDRLLGVLCLFTSRRHRFTRREVSLLRSFAAHAAVALETAELLDTASSRLRRLEALREIEREISLQRDPEALLSLISRRATELLEGDSATVYVLHEARGVLRAHASFNVGEWIRDVVILLGQGVVGVTAARREGMIVNDYPRSPYAIPPFRDQDWALVGQPLLHGEVLHGVILVRRESVGRPFIQADLVQLGDFAVQASIALENARVLRLASARAERVKAAAEVGRLLASARDADRILDVIADKCREILRAEAFGLFRFDTAGRLRYVRGFGLDEAFMREHTLAVGEGVVGKAAAERRSVVTEDILRDPAITLSPEARARVERAGSRAIVAMPIVTREVVLGVLALYHPPGFRAPAEEIEFLETLANHAAAALENARLFAETRRRQQTAETLAALTQTLTASLDLSTVFSHVADGIRRLLGSDGGAIGLLERDGTIRLAVAQGLGAETFRNLVVRPGQGIAGRILGAGEPFWTADYANDPRIARELVADAQAAGLVGQLAVPVRLRGQVVGVLWAAYGRPVEIDQDAIALACDLARVVAIAVENARLYQEARQREAEARALFEVGRLISATLDPERVFDLIVEKVLELMRVRACGIFRLDADSVLRYARGAGLSSEFIRALAVPLGEGTSGRSVAERAPVWSADLCADPAITLSPEVRRLVETEGYQAVLSVPILVKGAPFGSLATYWWEPHGPTSGEVETLTSLATLAAVALENARLYGETRQYVERLERLNQLNRTVSASLRLDEVLEAISQAAGGFFGASLVALWIADEERRVLTMRASCGDAEVRARIPARLAYGQGGAGWVAEHREPLLDVSLAEDPRIAAREWAMGQGIESFTGAPVLLGDRLLGVLTLGRRGATPLSSADRALLHTLLGQAATAIQNARLYEGATQAYEDLKTAQEELVRTEKLRALGEMASGVAHDFNNLLAAILGRVQLILRKVEDPALRQWLEVIERAALDGAQTVRQIQEFTRVRRDQPTQTVDLNQVIREAVEMTQTRWRGDTQSRGIEVQVVERLDPVPPIDGHPAELREVLTNLILNAVDALPSGGTITVATRQVDATVEVRVADTGSGMSDAVRARIFEPFFSTKGPRGTGLGLAMVYGIVSRHGGEITVDSTEGQGSTFTIRLPVGRQDDARPEPPVTLPAEARVRVLVIDDEEHVREILADMLRLEQHEVVVAEDGAAGLERFRDDAFDLVMTDLGMPGMSGWQVAQAIKAIRPDVPVVLVTGWGVEVPADQLRVSGVDRVMTKPFMFEDVRRLVGSFRRPRPGAPSPSLSGEGRQASTTP